MKKPRIDRRRYPRELLSRIRVHMALEPRKGDSEAWKEARKEAYARLESLLDTFPPDLRRTGYYGQKGGLKNPFYSTKP